MSKTYNQPAIPIQIRGLRVIWVIEQAREPIFWIIHHKNLELGSFVIVSIEKIFGPELRCHYHFEAYNQLPIPIQIRNLRLIWVHRTGQGTDFWIIHHKDLELGSFVIVSIVKFFGLNFKCHYHVEAYNYLPNPIQIRNLCVIWVIEKAREPIFGLSITKIWNLEVCNSFYCEVLWS